MHKDHVRVFGLFWSIPPPGTYVEAEQQNQSLLSNMLLSWLLNNCHGIALSPEMDLKLLTILDKNEITMAG